jgi:hypothetical protein
MTGFRGMAGFAGAEVPVEAVIDRAYAVLSFRFRVRSQIPQIVPAMDHLLAPFRADGAAKADATYSFVSSRASEERFALHRGPSCARRSDSPVLLLEYLLWEINSRAIASVEGHVAVHAAAASFDGRAILFPAPPNGGKTTTVAGLVRAGFDYLTDEAALINLGTLELHPYPRHLALEPRSAAAIFGIVPAHLERWRGAALNVSPDDLREGSIGAPCPVDAVIFPRYALDDPTRLSPLSRSEALEGLVRNSFNLARWRSRGFEVLAELVRRAECYTLTMGDLPSAVDVVRGLFETNGRVRSRIG